MPHVKTERRALCLELKNIRENGELHFHFGQDMQKQFLKDPCYNTLSKIRWFYVQSARDQKYFKQVRKVFNCPLDVVLNEAALAWEFFKSEVADKYEDIKKAQNGNAYQLSVDKIKELSEAPKQ
jgi:hypothetical protein